MPPSTHTRRRTPAAAIATLALLVLVLAAAASSTADRDRQPPRIVAAVVEDANNDSRPDRLRLTYSEPIRHRRTPTGAIRSRSPGCASRPSARPAGARSS